MTDGWRALLSVWQEYRFEVEEFRELDDERVLVLIRLRGRGKTSGLELEHFGGESANVVQIRHGKVVRLTLCFNRGRGLSDLGLTS